MSTIIFVMLPEIGHVNASFKLSKQLKGRGHQVYHLAIPDFEQYIESQSLGVLPFFKSLYPNGFALNGAFKYQNLETLDALKALLEMKAPDGKGVMHLIMEEILRLAGKIRPDLMIVDALLPEIALVSCKIHIPTILLSTNLDNHLDDSDRIAYKYLEKIPELVLCPKEFDFARPERRNSACYYAEASIDLLRSDTAFPWEKLEKGKPLIYCSLGSQSHLMENGKQFLQTMIDAMAELQSRQLVLTIGEHLFAEDFRPLPPNVFLVQRAPQIEMLKKASLMICHGGFNSVKESILFGVPMIVFPLIRDHPMVAARVEHHKLGLRGNILNATVNSICALIDKIDQDPSIRMSVRSMGERFREIEDSAVGAELIESLLAQQRRGAGVQIPIS
jgi:UDP:flavonoid glycosyltransferase YjiC (YdhE family)